MFWWSQNQRSDVKWAHLLLWASMLGRRWWMPSAWTDYEGRRGWSRCKIWELLQFMIQSTTAPNAEGMGNECGREGILCEKGLGQKIEMCQNMHSKKSKSKMWKNRRLNAHPNRLLKSKWPNWISSRETLANRRSTWEVHLYLIFTVFF